MQNYYDERGYFPFDIAACHPYPEVYTDPKPANPGKLGLARVMNERFKAIMNKHGDKDKKVWITELGWNSAHNDETTQRNALAKSFNVIDELTDPENPTAGPYVDQYIWFKYDGWAKTEDWGIVDTFRSRRKPSYDAFEALSPGIGARPVLTVDGGPGAPVWGVKSDKGLPLQVSGDDLLDNHVAELKAGTLQYGTAEALTNGRYDADDKSVLGSDGQYAGPIRLVYLLNDPVVFSEIRLFAGQSRDGGNRAFLSAAIHLDGKLAAEDVRTGSYGQKITARDQSAASVAVWKPADDSPWKTLAANKVEIEIYPSSSWNGDFRDRWSPVTDPDKDTDGAGPAYIAPIIKEIDAFGKIAE